MFASLQMTHLVYLTISALTDCHTLQSDLHKLEKWEEEWLMSLNPDKCEIIHISRKQKPIIFQYTLNTTRYSSQQTKQNT